MITCEKCGTQMLENSPTCPGCGAEVTPAQSEQTESQAEAQPAPAASDTTPAAADETPATMTPAAPAATPPATPRAVSATSHGMSSVTKAIIAAAVAVVAAIGLIFWQARHASAYTALTSLTPEDMTLIAESSSEPMEQLQLSQSADARKKFAESIRQLLAVAADAREKGYADKPEMKRQFDLMRDLVVAQSYVKKQRDANPNSQDWRPKPEEIEAFTKDPNNQKQAEQYLQDLQALGAVPKGQPLDDAAKQRFLQQWAPVALVAKKGMAAGLDKDRGTQLQIQLQQSKALAELYIKDVSDKFKPTDQDIEQYYAQHPELDPKVARQKAEDILKRVRAGEDFAALAKQYSDDPGSKDKGGDLGWFGRGQMVKQFEDAAFALKDNQISDIVESPYGFHIIQVTGHRMSSGNDSDKKNQPKSTSDQPPNDKTSAKQPEEQIQARHILIQTTAPSQNPFAPPQSGREAASDAIVQEKTKNFVDDLVKRSNIKVPDDFPVKAPEVPQGLSPHGNAGGPSPDEDEDEMDQAPPPPSDSNPNAKPSKPPTGAQQKNAAPGKKK